MKRWEGLGAAVPGQFADHWTAALWLTHDAGSVEPYVLPRPRTPFGVSGLRRAKGGRSA